ncbi:hypothetical protein Tco_0344771 [Tanacetum coccineum]
MTIMSTFRSNGLGLMALGDRNIIWGRSAYTRVRRWHYDSHVGERAIYLSQRGVADKDARSNGLEVKDETEKPSLCYIVLSCGQTEMVKILNNSKRFIGLITQFTYFIELNSLRFKRADDMPISAYTALYGVQPRWVFCMLYGRPRERHPVCLTKRHDFRPLSFQEFFLNHDLTLQPAHLSGDDTRWRDDE